MYVRITPPTHSNIDEDYEVINFIQMHSSILFPLDIPVPAKKKIIKINEFNF
jgi:hypothetical protein